MSYDFNAILKSVHYRLDEAIDSIMDLDDPIKKELLRKVDNVIQLISKQKPEDPLPLIGRCQNLNQIVEACTLQPRPLKKLNDYLFSRVLETVLAGYDQGVRDKVQDTALFQPGVGFLEPVQDDTKELTKMPMMTFDALSNDQVVIDYDTITQAFKNELESLYKDQNNTIDFDGKRALSFLCYIFDESLSKGEDQAHDSNEPEKGVHVFFNTFRKMRREKNEHKETVTIETFKNLVQGGQSPLDKSDPYIKALMKEIKTGAWKDDEEKELLIIEITDEEKQKINPLLDKIMNSKSFANTLTRYFQQILGPQE